MPKLNEAANIVGFTAVAGLIGWVLGKLVSQKVIAPLGVIKIEAGNPEAK